MHVSCVLIRHGKTTGNEQKRYIGNRTDESLSETGVRESETVRAQMVRLVPQDAVLFSSPMKRCMETAGILFPDRQVLSDIAFTEIDFGDFEGKNFQELKDDPAYRAWVESGCMADIPHGESVDVFRKRSYEGFLNLLEYPCFALVCHGGNIMSIMSELTGSEYHTFHVNNLNGYRLELENDGKRICDLSYDCLFSRDHT